MQFMAWTSWLWLFVYLAETWGQSPYCQGECAAGEQDGILLQLQSTSTTTSGATMSTMTDTTSTTRVNMVTMPPFVPAPPIDQCATRNQIEPKRECNNGWRLNYDKFNDGVRCDCPECEDEIMNSATVNCIVCSCPTRCDQQVASCPGSLPGASPLLPECEEALRTNPKWALARLELPDVPLESCENALHPGWSIPGYLRNNTDCDCPDCEDEDDLAALEDCKGKRPTICGSYIPCNIAESVTEELAEVCRIGTEYELGTRPPYFKCSNGWTIPLPFYNDVYCDCEDCGDEPSFSCELCGECPSECGMFTDCQDALLRLNYPNAECFENFRILTLNFEFTDETGAPIFNAFEGVYECERAGDEPAWQIPERWLNDFYCNCPLCDDERDNNLDCDVCLCPTTCSSGIYCDGSLGLWGYFAFDVSDLNPELFPFPENEQTCKDVYAFDDDFFFTDDGFYVQLRCRNGWVLPGSFYNDNDCDCPDCEDEDYWTCQSCGACPISCGAFAPCGPQPACAISDFDSPFYCGSGGGGFFIDFAFVDDDYCDCPQREDERRWNCTTCGGCPVICQDFFDCSIGRSTQMITFNTTEDYVDNPPGIECKEAAVVNDWFSEILDDLICDPDSDGRTWAIPESYEGDGYCDCRNCEDEANSGYDCSICTFEGICPKNCGDSIPCQRLPSLVEVNGKQKQGLIETNFVQHRQCDFDLPVEEWPYVFNCSNGWRIPGFLENNGACDCRDCGDELEWDCQKCGACPITCGASVNCTEVFGDCPPPIDPWSCPQTPEFVIEQSQRNDRSCHCPNCEDEVDFDCSTCGACPIFCGDYVECNFGISPVYATLRLLSDIDRTDSSSSTSTASLSTSVSSTSSLTASSSTSISQTSASSSTSVAPTSASSTASPSTSVSSTSVSSTSSSPTSASLTSSPLRSSSSTSSPSGTSATSTPSGPRSTSLPGTSSTATASGTSLTPSPSSTGPPVPADQRRQHRQQRRERRRERRRQRWSGFSEQDTAELPQRRLKTLQKQKRSAPPAPLGDHYRGFYKAKLHGPYGSRWDPDQMNLVPGHFDPVYYQKGLEKRKATVKSGGIALDRKHNISAEERTKLVADMKANRVKKNAARTSNESMISSHKARGKIANKSWSTAGNASCGASGRVKARHLHRKSLLQDQLVKHEVEQQVQRWGRRRRRRRQWWQRVAEEAARRKREAEARIRAELARKRREAEAALRRAAEAVAREAERLKREAEEAARKLEEERKRVQAQLEREAAELRAKVDAGLSFVGGVVDDFIANTAEWSVAFAKSAVQFGADLKRIGEQVTVAVVDAVQDAWEFAGDFVTDAFQAGRDWFLGFVEDILDKLDDSGAGFIDLASNLAGGAAYPGDIETGDSIEPIFGKLGDILKDEVLVPLGPDLQTAGSMLGDAISAFLGDEDMFSAIFGKLGSVAVQSLADVVSGKSGLNVETALDALNKIKEVCATYLKKYLLPVVTAIEYLGKQIAKRVKEDALPKLQNVILEFISGLIPNPDWRTWYVGICGGMSIGRKTFGACILFPFTIDGGSDTLRLDRVTLEYSMGKVKPLAGKKIKKGDGGKSLGVRIGYIVTGDQTAVQGDAVSRGINVDIKGPGKYPYPDVTVGLGRTFTKKKKKDRELLSIDLAVSGSFTTPKVPQPGKLEFERFTDRAQGWAPFGDEEAPDGPRARRVKKGRVRPLPSYSVDGLSTNPVTALSHVDDVLVVGARNVPLTQHIGRTSGLLQRTAVTGDIQKYVLEHFHSLNEERRNIYDFHVAGNRFYNVTDFAAKYSEHDVRKQRESERSQTFDDAVRTTGSAIEGNTRVKYGNSGRQVLRISLTVFRILIAASAQKNQEIQVPSFLSDNATQSSHKQTGIITQLVEEW